MLLCSIDGWRNTSRTPSPCNSSFVSSSRTEPDDANEEEKDQNGRSGGRRTDRDQPVVTRKFYVGQWLDVKDTVNNWLEATVMDMADSGEQRVTL